MMNRADTNFFIPESVRALWADSDADSKVTEAMESMSLSEKDCLEISRHPGSTKAIYRRFKVGLENHQGWLNEDDTKFAYNTPDGWRNFWVTKTEAGKLVIEGIEYVFGQVFKENWTL